MENRKMLSIIDVARLAGVSTATVSHVINKSGRFSKETEEKVMKVIEQYGYVSNNNARSLKSSASHTVGLIIPNINNDFFSSIAVTIEQFFDYYDYSLFICNTDNDPQKERRYFRRLDSMRVDGIIVISCQKRIEKDVISRNIPIVLLDRIPENDMDLPVVTSDSKNGIYQATTSLIEKGCRNIIFISSFLATYVSTNRSEGYLEAMHDHGLPASRKSIIQLESGPSIVHSETSIYNYISRGNKVDGIVCTSDNQAIGAMEGVRRRGLRVPEDIKVYGFDNQFQSRISTPTLSTVERSPSSLGKISSEVLMNLIRNKPAEKTTVLSCSLVQRESTAS
ncbi:MAG: LacI family transcriptional regulator [Erysipelotrichaceae bacterium]|nr:LacI family transcriptional regulator [Erysipelotrichaceae bacterium]